MTPNKQIACFRNALLGEANVKPEHRGKRLWFAQVNHPDGLTYLYEYETRHKYKSHRFIKGYVTFKL